jgi:hypothetical protein
MLSLIPEDMFEILGLPQVGPVPGNLGGISSILRWKPCLPNWFWYSAGKLGSVSRLPTSGWCWTFAMGLSPNGRRQLDWHLTQLTSENPVG